MSSGVLDLGLRVPKQKRVYSKGGCRECKRRKIKCDEGKPQCWQCVRLRKSCTYPGSGERILRISKKKQQAISASSSNSSHDDHKQDMDSKSSSTESPNDTHIISTTKESTPEDSPHKRIKLNPEQSQYLNPITTANLNQQQQQQQNQHHSLLHHHHPPPPPPHHVLTIPPPPPMVGVPVPSQYPHYQYQQQQQSQQPHISPSIPSLSTQQHTYPPPPPPSSYTLPSLMPRYSSISNLLNEKIQGYNNHHYTAPLAPFHRPSLVPLQSSTAITQQASAPSSSTITQIHPTSQPQLSATVSQPQTSEDILQYLDQGDLNLIASDLNNIVNNIMFELNFENKNIYDSTVMNTTDTDRSTSSTATSPLFPRALPGSIPRNIPFEYIKLRKSHEKLYLEEFYNDFANIILPFSSYDETSKAYFNPARDIILKSASNESFLLAAVLAQGAKLSFQKNKLAEDEEAYCNYLSKCLKLLGPALIINDEKNNDELTSNIEAVLLTVLLLTAANASNTKQDWRPHLKGAKDILMKTSTKKIQNSKILIFCKSWFVTLEILAGISSTKGGTLTYTEEIDSLLSSGDEYEVSVLKELGIILDNGFNIFGGYHNDCIDHLRELIKIKNKIRKEDKKNFNPQDSFDYMKLFSQFYRQSEIEFLNHKGILVEADFKDNIVPAGPLIDILSINNEKVIISWMDTCHQAYVYASMITILIECFKENYNSPQVQILTNKIISFVSFLQNSSAEVPQQKFKCAMMMIQWPMLVAGQNCITEDSKFILMKFFRMSAQIGSGGASFALKRITSIWKRREKNSTESESEDDKGLDLVSY